jgi:glycosyltransferase involved in cell wall biosynthesis
MRALSDALPFEEARSLDASAVVLQLGPALSVRGGISSVEKMIVAQLSGAVEVRHIATTEDGSTWLKMKVFLHAVRTLRTALREHDRAVVHIHFASRGSTVRKAILAWMTLNAGKPLILHAHGGYFDKFFARLPRLLQRQLSRIFERADCFLVLSTQWRDFYTRHLGVPARSVRILPNPTALPKIVPARIGREHVQFLFLGRINESKGAFLLLQAFEALPPQLRTRARLVFAGDGEVEKLRSLAQAHAGAVDVYSWVNTEQRDELLAASDVFALPSHLEGLPMALLEAMASGLPVITTAVGGIPDVVTDRCEGFLVQPGDVDALRDAMAQLISDESSRLALGQRARLRAEDFDVKHFAAELSDIYRRVLR